MYWQTHLYTHLLFHPPLVRSLHPRPALWLPLTFYLFSFFFVRLASIFAIANESLTFHKCVISVFRIKHKIQLKVRSSVGLASGNQWPNTHSPYSQFPSFVIREICYFGTRVCHSSHLSYVSRFVLAAQTTNHTHTFQLSERKTHKICKFQIYSKKDFCCCALLLLSTSNEIFTVECICKWSIQRD